MLIETTLNGFRLKKRTVSVVIADNNEIEPIEKICEVFISHNDILHT